MVARMTPVPKFFSMKKSTAGMRKIEVCLDNVGNDGAVDAAD